MLVLSRELDQEIILSEDNEAMKIIAKIKIVRIESGKVRLGIECNNSVRIDRKEIYEERVAERYEQ